MSIEGGNKKPTPFRLLQEKVAPLNLAEQQLVNSINKLNALLKIPSPTDLEILSTNLKYNILNYDILKMIKMLARLKSHFFIMCGANPPQLELIRIAEARIAKTNESIPQIAKTVKRLSTLTVERLTLVRGVSENDKQTLQKKHTTINQNLDVLMRLCDYRNKTQ